MGLWMIWVSLFDKYSCIILLINWCMLSINWCLSTRDHCCHLMSQDDLQPTWKASIEGRGYRNVVCVNRNKPYNDHLYAFRRPAMSEATLMLAVCMCGRILYNIIILLDYPVYSTCMYSYIFVMLLHNMFI